jgi:predicted short-subunit dehydrogenase-like oxidoreductase (DUF2520 family)
MEKARMAKTLNIIGCGRVGRTLARLWAQNRAFEIGDVFDNALDISVAAAAFIGHGRAVSALGQMRRADVWMLTPPDDQIAACCAALAGSGLLAAGDIVFHCSGALPARDLAPAAARGAAVASVHPLKSFADPAIAVRTFSGTYCAADGDPAALAVLRPAFERIGGIVSDIDPGFKTVYHAASVIVCNYLTALLETGVRCYEKAGFTRDDALRMMEPLVRETLDNVFKLGTVKALTGPIARGDHAVVARQVEALAAWEPRIAALYKELGAVAVDLARAQGKADAGALAAIERTLAGDSR